MRYTFSMALLVSLVLTLNNAAQAAGPYGDSVLHLGSTGYATLPDSSVSDLDYTTDFSVEALVDVEPNTAGGRWAHIVGKSARTWDNTSGFALAFDPGDYDSFGQQICAKVGDGTNGVQVESTFYQGVIHALLTWNAGSKTMSLYVNGVLSGMKTDANIIPANIKNTSDLQLGSATSFQPLGRDILLARLWNRELSAADASALYNNFNTNGSHAIPATVSTVGLKSEWLMQETSAADGKAGTTNIKDTAGSNHQLLQGGAILWKGDGALTLEEPSNGATGISPAVILKVSGGLGTLGSGPTKALSYYLQIDESPSFNTSALKESGWLQGNARWKPVLKPNTTYYWHAKVRDSSTSPLISSYTTANSFATRASRDWYAGPGVYTGQVNGYSPVSQTGVYGTQNGTSYANAWNGIRDIVWGEDGVSAGDNLYICGNHTYTINVAGYFPQQAIEFVKESGYSANYPITIRMDCPSDPGSLWGAALDNVNGPGPAAWSGPDANGVYWSSNLKYGAAAQMVNGNLVWLDIETAPTWTGHPGATYSENGVTYVKTADGSNPAGKIYSGGLGFQFHLSRSSFIKFYKASFYNSFIGKERLNDTSTSIPPSHHITFDASVLEYARGNGDAISLYGGHNNWIIRNSEIAYTPNGIYTHGYDRYDGYVGPQNILIENNKIHDIGIGGSGDCHAIGVQSGTGHTIQNNEIYNGGGSAIEFWTGSEPMTNMIVRNNFIHDIYVDANCGTSSGGIVVSGDNVATVKGLRVGYQIYGNIIMNTGSGALASGYDWHGWGIAAGLMDFIKIYNNVMYNTRGGIFISSTPPNCTDPKYALDGGQVYNNMVINPWGGSWVIFSNNTCMPATISVDYNLFYPQTSTSPDFAVTNPTFTHDQHSIFADPKFVSASPINAADFKLQIDSPAIDKGKDVGLPRDFAGTTIPQGAAPDIGVFEFTTIPRTPAPAQNLRVISP